MKKVLGFEYGSSDINIVIDHDEMPVTINFYCIVFDSEMDYLLYVETHFIIESGDFNFPDDYRKSTTLIELVKDFCKDNFLKDPYIKKFLLEASMMCRSSMDKIKNQQDEAKKQIEEYDNNLESMQLCIKRLEILSVN